MNRAAAAGSSWIESAGRVLLALPVGAFTLFVGYNKALAPLSVLVEHSAWTIHIPALLGRMVGWVEVAAALTLLASLAMRRLARPGLIAACCIALTHNTGALIHIGAGEWQALPQSAVLFVLCAALIWLCARHVRNVVSSGEGVN